MVLVEVIDVLSDERDMEQGALQGSILDPTLFIIYINDLFALNCKGHNAFANNTDMFFVTDRMYHIKLKAVQSFKLIRTGLFTISKLKLDLHINYVIKKIKRYLA